LRREGFVIDWSCPPDSLPAPIRSPSIAGHHPALPHLGMDRQVLASFCSCYLLRHRAEKCLADFTTLFSCLMGITALSAGRTFRTLATAVVCFRYRKAEEQGEAHRFVQNCLTESGLSKDGPTLSPLNSPNRRHSQFAPSLGARPFSARTAAVELSALVRSGLREVIPIA